jgi:hypothetical protein
LNKKEEVTMKAIISKFVCGGIGLLSAVAVQACAADGGAGVAERGNNWWLENDTIAWQWRMVDGKLAPGRAEDKLNGGSLSQSGDMFRVVLGDGTTLRTSDFTLEAPPAFEKLKPEPQSSTLAHRLGGRQLTAKLSAPGKNLKAEWCAILREGSSYVRQELTLQAVGKDVLVREIVLFEQKVPDAKTLGTVDGSPVVAGNFFFGYEHPMARNAVDQDQLVRCSFTRNAVLKEGESLTQSCVTGIVPRGQLRRGFLEYVERERAHPYRPFLHYNSWFDIAWDKQKFNETQSLDAMAWFGRELIKKRGVRMESFLFDDGWDDNKTLWKFHSGFPNGFKPLKQAAADLQAPGIAVWVSPFGGYDAAKLQRLEYGRQQGFETNASGFSLSGPKYYQRFHDVCMTMLNEYGINQFKFDGLAAGANANGNNTIRDGDAMLRLIADLRRAKPDLYISQTVGTWPSPFWLLYVDSTWRGGADHAFAGKGSTRQQWITYRDQLTYQNVVQRGPLYPLNSLMLHGVIYAVNADKLTTTENGDFRDEVTSFFGTGTQLQELYLTPRLLNQQNWDDLAESAKWSRANANVLVDTHWVGGDPGKNQVYGWASWSPRKGILVLRNPDDKPASLTADVSELFELPKGVAGTFRLQSPWKKDSEMSPIDLRAGRLHTFQLEPFQVLVMETATAGLAASK